MHIKRAGERGRKKPDLYLPADFASEVHSVLGQPIEVRDIETAVRIAAAKLNLRVVQKRAKREPQS